MDLILAFGAGLLTLINPCVLPVVPIVMASAMQAHRWGPLVLAAGMSVSFVTLGLLVTAFGRSIGLTPEIVADAGAVVMIGFGLVLLVPRLSGAFALASTGLSARADTGLDTLRPSGLGGQAVAGLLLGAVWSPCIGPTLGGAIALASQGASLGQAGAVMAAFALGVSAVILALGYGTRGAIQRRQALLRRLAPRARPTLGMVFVAVGAALLLRLHYIAEGWLLGVLPAWLIDLSVSL